MTSGDTIALVDGDYFSEVCEQVYGDSYRYIYYESIEDCLKAVSSKQVDGTVLLSYEAEFYRQNHKYRNLTYNIVDEGSYSISIAVSGEADPRLYSIIQKGLNSISKGEISNIFNNTLLSLQNEDFFTLIYNNPVPTLILCIALTALLVAVILGILFIRRLKRQNTIIGEKNMELEAAVQKAEAATQSKTMFLANMSHDMRTPMNAIIGLSNLAMDFNTVEELKDYMVKINYSGKQLLALINDTLDVSRIENGKLTMNREYIMSSQLLQEGVASTKVIAEQKGIRFRLEQKDFHDALLYVDAVKITKLFTNLLSNAVKFTPPGGEVVFFIYRLGETGNIAHYQMGVRDTGIGMSQEFLEHIFEPFAQEKTDYATNYSGTGLGMTIVKEFADFLGAKIEIKSELNKGTEVTVYIDYQQADKQPEKTVRATMRGVTETTRILVAEDHPLNAEIVRKLLEKQGYLVELASNGKECVSEFIKSPVGYYSLVLMDIRMPEMDGLEAAKTIRKCDREDAAGIPIIAMTANAFEQDIKESLAAGMNGHLAKPIEPQVLYDTIAQKIKAIL